MRFLASLSRVSPRVMLNAALVVRKTRNKKSHISNWTDSSVHTSHWWVSKKRCQSKISLIFDCQSCEGLVEFVKSKSKLRHFKSNSFLGYNDRKIFIFQFVLKTLKTI
jgi:hypothetical protein